MGGYDPHADRPTLMPLPTKPQAMLEKEDFEAAYDSGRRRSLEDALEETVAWLESSVPPAAATAPPPRSGDDAMNTHPAERPAPGVRSIRPRTEFSGQQRLTYFLGVSAQTAGSRGLCMHIVTIPPGARSTPHSHSAYETAIYVLEGRVETRWGDGLRESVINEAGEFLYIPAGVPHEAINLSETEWVRAIVARNDSAETENVEPYPPPPIDAPEGSPR